MKILGQIRRDNKKTGFTIMEVMIATIIFSLVMAGFFASISQLRRPAAESSQEVTAAFVGKQRLDWLRGQVSAESWGNTLNPLFPGTHTNQIVVDSTTYNIDYTVAPDPDGTRARMVTMNITW